MVQGGTYRHVALGAETSGRGWRVVGAVDVQVECVSLWQSEWGAIDLNSGYEEEHE